jgi:hypothetical protein
MPIYKARGKQDSRQGQKIGTSSGGKWATDQYGHRLYSVQGSGYRSSVGLNNKTVHNDGVERFKGTAKACIEYCKAHRGHGYVIVALVRSSK